MHPFITINYFHFSFGSHLAFACRASGFGFPSWLKEPLLVRLPQVLIQKFGILRVRVCIPLNAAELVLLTHRALPGECLLPFRFLLAYMRFRMAAKA